MILVWEVHQCLLIAGSAGGQLIQSDFDLKSLFRRIALSDAYRLSSGSADVNEERQRLFAQMNVKMLTAEQMYDCISVATMPGDVSADPTTGMVVRFGNTSREQFLREFGHRQTRHRVSGRYFHRL